MMAKETTDVAQEELTTNTPEVSESADSPVETASEEKATSNSAHVAVADHAAAESVSSEANKAAQGNAPDALQPFIDKAYETIQHDVELVELGKFLRTHIKTFQEEWDIWPDNTKDAYVHMMTSQLLQRKAAKTRIMNYEEFKLPVPSAQTTLFESIKHSQIKPQRCIPVLLMPPNLRPTYALKK
jgi:hypothetical protein